MCDTVSYRGVTAGQIISQYFDCNGREDCRNTVADEHQACGIGEELYQCKDNITGQIITTNKLCDYNCDCWLCDDESVCNGVEYGMMCEKNNHSTHVHPAFICNGLYSCTDRTDEMNCTTNRTCKVLAEHIINHHKFNDGVRHLKQNQMCAPPFRAKVCSDGLDQVNCTDPVRLAMSCTLAGYHTNISIFGVCHGYPLCDDDYNNKCLEPEGGCIIHKTALCDGILDCPGGADETETSCGILSNKVNCVRRVAKMKAKGLKITYKVPLNWPLGLRWRG